MGNSLTKINSSILVQGLWTEISSVCWPRKGFSLGAHGLESHSYLEQNNRNSLHNNNNKQKERETHLYLLWLPRHLRHPSVSFITILAASWQDCQLSTGSDCFSDSSYVSCQANFTERSISHRGAWHRPPHCSGSGADGRRTGLHHSPNADWLASKHHWGIIKPPNPLLRVVFSLRVEADGHIFIQPQRKYGREKVLP